MDISVSGWAAKFQPIDRLLCFGGCLLVALAAARSLTWKVGNDQAVFTVIGQTILDGGLPYRDAWDLKGPLTFYVYAFSLWAWHRPGLSIRIFDLFAVVACTYVMGRLLSEVVRDARLTCWSTIYFLLMYFSLGFWNTSQPDGWGGFILVGVILLLVSPPWKTVTSMAVVGGLIATATLLKPTFALYLALPIAFPCSHAANRSHKVRDVVVCIATYCLIVSIPIILLCVAIGGWGDVLDIVGYFAAHASIRVRLDVLGAPYFLAYLAPITLAAFGVVMLYRATDRRLANIMALWSGIGILIIAVQGKYFGYHFIPVLVSAVAPICVAVKFIASLNRNWLLRAACIVVLGPLASYSVNTKDSSGVYERPQAEMAAYIVAHSGASDSILVMSGELQPVYALSHRRPPTRFVYSDPLVVNSQLKAKYRSLFMQEIHRDAPFYVLFDSREAWFSRGFPEFDYFLRTKYALVSRIGTSEIWQMKRPCCIKEHALSPEAQNFDLGPWGR